MMVIFPQARPPPALHQPLQVREPQRHRHRAEEVQLRRLVRPHPDEQARQPGRLPRSHARPQGQARPEEGREPQRVVNIEGELLRSVRFE